MYIHDRPTLHHDICSPIGPRFDHLSFSLFTCWKHRSPTPYLSASELGQWMYYIIRIKNISTKCQSFNFRGVAFRWRDLHLGESWKVCRQSCLTNGWYLVCDSVIEQHMPRTEKFSLLSCRSMMIGPIVSTQDDEDNSDHPCSTQQRWLKE